MGNYISQMPWTPTRLIVSDMTRARQTFEILLDALPKNVAPTVVLPSLRECRPCQVTPPPSPRIWRLPQRVADHPCSAIAAAPP